MLLFFLLKGTDPPLDFWHDSTVQFAINVGIALVVGIGTAIVTIAIFRRQQRQAQEERANKELMYEVVSAAPIANINKAVADRVEIRFDGQPVNNMFLLILRIVNTGNVAVKPEDYAEPLEVIFKDSKIISSDILETSPKNLISESNLKDFFRLGEHSLKLTPILLNQGESLATKILLVGDQHDIELRARIADGHMITATEEKKREDAKAEQKRRRSYLQSIISLISGAITALTINIMASIFLGNSAANIVNVIIGIFAILTFTIFYIRLNIVNIFKRK